MCLLINTNIELLLGNEVTQELYNLFNMRWASTNIHSQLPRNTRKIDSEEPELFRKEQMFQGEPEWKNDTRVKYCFKSNFQF